MEGWIKLHRKMQQNWIWEDPKKVVSWIHFLFLANYEDKEILIGTNKVLVPRGSFVASVRRLSENLPLTYQELRTFIRQLQANAVINAQLTQGLTQITICKYEEYQDDQRTTISNLTQQLTPFKEEKKKKEKKEKVEKEKKEKVEKEKFDISETPPENFSSPKFRKVWKEWISFRRESGWSTKESYLKSASRNLDKLAGDNTSTAVKIIQYSMDQGYQGLFALKDDTRRPNPRNGAKKPEGHFDHIKSRTIQL